MRKLFDFSDTEKYEHIIQSTWVEFRNSLANKEFTYDNIPLALTTRFLRVFDDHFQHGFRFLRNQFAQF